MQDRDGSRNISQWSRAQWKFMFKKSSRGKKIKKGKVKSLPGLVLHIYTME